MFALREAQMAFAATLRGGPDYCPDGLFTGTRDRALLGLKVHANTISHARLVALEETFPHTRAAMGEGEFNALSRFWLDAGYGDARPLAMIGAAFPDWLAKQAPGGAFAALARFEWLWLESYHAAEARPLLPEAMQAISPEALLDLIISHHPAARLTASDEPIANLLDLPESPSHVLLSRPGAGVLVHPLTSSVAATFDLFDGKSNLGAVLETFWAGWPKEDAVAGINHLIALGALTVETASC